MKIKKRWKIKDQAKLFCRLGHLLDRGYSLSTAIEFLMLYVNDEKKKDLEFIILKLKQGSPFFTAFHTFQFSNDGLSIIYFAEKYGDLAKGLLNAGKILEMKEAYKKNITKVFRYPLFLLILLVVLITAMQKVLIPQFVQLYQSMNLPQSKIISFILYIKTFFPIIGLILLIIFFVLLLTYFFIYRKRTVIDRYSFLSRVPFVGYVVKKYNTYFFSFHLGNLLDNGMSINEALTVFEQQKTFVFFLEEAKRLRACLLEGDQLAVILKNTNYYDKELATVILHGQANGILSSELIDYSHLILEEFEETFTFWLRILQPAIMIFIGLFIVLLYLAVMLPIYGMIQTI